MTMWPGQPYAGSPFSYFDTPSASRMGLVELIPGARNLAEYCQIRPDEQVLILTEHTVDETVIQAIAAAATYRGADVSVLWIEPFSPGGYDHERQLDLARAAHHAVDVVIACTWWAEVHTEPLFFSEVAKREARFVSLHMAATASMLLTGARTPPQVMYELIRRAQEELDGAREIRFTTALGTDVTFYDAQLTPDDGPLQPGGWRPFPYGGVNFYPASTAGRLVMEDTTATGVPEEKLTVRLEDNRVVSIEGGLAAQQMEEYSPTGYYMRHALIGLNPKVRIANATQFEREKHAGACYVGLDALEKDGSADPSKPGFAHCDAQFDRPTIYVDGREFVTNGTLHLLRDERIREVASRFGPPDVILDPNPQIYLPKRFTGASMSDA